jgi:CBS domain-containing protein
MRIARPDAKQKLLGTAAQMEARRARSLRWAQVTARDLMRERVVTVADTAPLSEVERTLIDNGVSGAPVTNGAGRVVGIVSWRDVIERYVQDPDARPRRGPGFFELSSEELADEDLEAVELPEESEDTAADVMTSQVFSVPPDAGLAEVAAVMVKHGIHRVLVEEEGRFCGILGTLDILKALSA